MSSNTWYLLDFILAAVGIVFVRHLIKRSARSLPLPPGPKGLPIIGNVLDMPASHDWLTYAQWGEKYGDMTYVSLFGQPMLILNSVELAVDILDRKSSIYSDRPKLPFGGEMIGWKYALGILAYGDRFREYRRFFARVVGSKIHAERFAPIHEYQTRKFLKDVTETPEALADHVRLLVGASIMKISHGYHVKDSSDPLLNLAETALDQLSQLVVPGAFLAEVFPALLYLPKWCPGGRFKKIVAPWRKTLIDTTEKPYEFVQSQMRDHKHTPSFTSDLLESENLDEDKIFNIKWASMSFYSAGADTSVSAIRSFYLAMMLFPDVQRRAQAEIDTVVGSERLPTLADRKDLPYINALVNEVHRWNPVVPQGVPHRLIQDDIHNGYFIPKGTLVVPNQWNMLHNPADYPNPYTFDPTRYLAESGQPLSPDPRKTCFGFGRRICPGLYLADANIFISCAMSLAVFDISKPIESGKVIEPRARYTSGTVSHPEPFKCAIVPRSAKALALIQSIDQ